jgi:hypothetical protein
METIGGRSLARLLIESIQAGGNYLFCGPDDITDLRACPVRAIKRLCRSADITLADIHTLVEQESPSLFATFSAWFVFGDACSTDIDCILQVSSLHKPLLSSETARLSIELRESGYDVTRGLDINKVWIDPNGFIQFSKGGNETINMVMCTYDFHAQKYPLIFTEYIDLDMHQKSYALCTFITNKLEELTTSVTYAQLRDEKRTVYTTGGLERIDFAIKCMDYFDYSVDRSYDAWKSLIMKYLQLILFASSECAETRALYYQKMGLVELYALVYGRDDIDILKALLTRTAFTPDRVELFRTTVHRLHTHVKRIVHENLPRLDWNIQTIDTFDKDTVLSRPLFLSWTEDPIVVSDTFCDTWFNEYGEGNVTINDKFIEPNENIGCLDQHPRVRANVIDVPQKSSEWKELIKFYSCGNNTGVSPIDCTGPRDILRARSNLVMGCIGETLIAEYFDPSRCIENFSGRFTSCEVGLIVESVGERDSVGSCPDRLFVSSTEIIPAEFKTINGRPSENKGYCRSFTLAQRQIRRCAGILNSCEQGICVRGLMVFLWIYKDAGRWVFEMRGGIVQV